MSLIASAFKRSADGTHATTDAISTTGATLVVLVVAFADGSGDVLYTAVNDGLNTYVDSLARFVSGGVALKFLYVANPTTSGTHSVTVTSSARYEGIALLAFDNVPTSTPYDQQVGAGFSSGATSRQPGSVTPSQNNSLIVVASTLTATSTAGFAINSGFTTIGSVPTAGGEGYGIAVGYLEQGTAGAVNPALSLTSAGVCTTGQAVFKLVNPPGGGGGGGRRRATTSVIASLAGAMVPAAGAAGLLVPRWLARDRSEGRISIAA